MTRFEQTQTYQDIVARGHSDNITVAFHLKTDVFVTPENIDKLVQEEIAVYEAKLEEVRKLVPDFKIPSHLHGEIEHRINLFMNDYYCTVEYASFTSEDMLEIVAYIEAEPNFKEWLIK